MSYYKCWRSKAVLHVGTYTIKFYAEVDDTRDIMSDCLKPSIERTGRYQVQFENEEYGKHVNFHKVTIDTSKDSGNNIYRWAKRCTDNAQLESLIVALGCHSLDAADKGFFRLYPNEFHLKFMDANRGLKNLGVNGLEHLMSSPIQVTI